MRLTVLHPVGFMMAGLAAISTLFAQSPFHGEPVPPLDLILDSTTRLIVVAPHPDDETLGAAGLMHRVSRAGGAVRVVWLTSGDGFPEGVETEEGIARPKPQDYRNYGRIREDEARAAVGALGINGQALSFLGFPDEGLCELASTYLSAKARAFESPFTDRISPPITERVIRGVRYRGVDVRRELERLFTAFAPTIVVTVHPEDDHPDHCATYIFVREALDALSARGRARPLLLHYLIHYAHWPLTEDAGVGQRLRPPDGFPTTEGRWTSLALTQEEIAAKKRALLLYHSQMLVMGRFLEGFARSNELFLEGAPASQPECWCQNGINVATELPPDQYRRQPSGR
jgi:LmbE family N-acetylglucosaminyl deacetylase